MAAAVAKPTIELSVSRSNVVTVTLVTTCVALAINILGITGVIPGTNILAPVNLSLCGLSVIALYFLADKEESRLKQVAKLAAFIAPIILFNALALCGIAPFATSHILGWTSLAAAVVAFGVSLCSSGNSALKEIKAVREKYVKDITEEGKKKLQTLYNKTVDYRATFPDVPKQIIDTFQWAYAYCILEKTDKAMLEARTGFLAAYEAILKDMPFTTVVLPPKDPVEYMSWVMTRYRGKL